MTYNTSFASGALMPEASVQVARALREKGEVAATQEIVDVPSVAGRERKVMEIQRRLQQVNPAVWSDLPERSRDEQRIILYYCVLKSYRLIRDFHLDVVLERWRSLSPRITSYDVQRYLEEQAQQHPEIDEWSEGTWEKIQQVIRKMLREADLLRADELNKPDLSDAFWTRFVSEGDMWFLEAMFLNKAERERVLSYLTSH